MFIQFEDHYINPKSINAFYLKNIESSFFLHINVSNGKELLFFYKTLDLADAALFFLKEKINEAIQ